MKLKSINITDFKRFTGLRIHDLPKTARLIVLLGPNGSGKSSLFDALNTHLKTIRFFGFKQDDYAYFSPHATIRDDNDRSNYLNEIQNKVLVEFYEDGPTTENDYRKSLYLRTAYRNDPSFRNVIISEPPNILEKNRLRRLIDDDKAVEANYQRLIWRLLKKAMTPGLTTDSIMEEMVGSLQSSLTRVFGDLNLDALVTPDEHGAFTFSKGEIQNFLYENLSGGEKAAFDLLLDVFVNRDVYNDSIYCIDEPEVHLNTRLQGLILEELYRLIPSNSQLWIATHSIGMVRKAEELRVKDPSTVVFLDFGFRPDGEARNFDKAEEILPSIPDNLFWSRHYDVALDDLSKLVAPEQVVLCEGGSEVGKDGFDAYCYNRIFSKEYPHTLFVSVGSAEDIEKRVSDLLPLIKQIIRGTEIIRFRDRDDLTSSQIAINRKRGIRSLSTVRNLDTLLLSDEILIKLCELHNTPAAFEEIVSSRDFAIARSANTGQLTDNFKLAAQAVHHTSRKFLNMNQSGSTKEAFMRDILSPLVTPDTEAYRQLKDDIFG